jgi:hypothetical protein
MTTQTLRTQTNATIGRQEQVEAGKLVNFIESGKKFFGMCFNTNYDGIKYSANTTIKEKSEIDAYLNGVGLV